MAPNSKPSVPTKAVIQSELQTVVGRHLFLYGRIFHNDLMSIVYIPVSKAIDREAQNAHSFLKLQGLAQPHTPMLQQHVSAVLVELDVFTGKFFRKLKEIALTN